MYRNILVAIDGTASSMNEVDNAVGLAAALNSRVTILSVATRPCSFAFVPGGAPLAFVSEQIQANEQALQHAVARSSTEVPVRTRLREGNASREIVAEALENGHDLIVVGGRCGGRLAAAINGSPHVGGSKLAIPMLVVPGARAAM
jgi:nucleotide-binding universal stress UspA family protein